MNLISIQTAAGLTGRLVKHTNGDRTVLVRQFEPFENEIEITLDQAEAIAAVVQEAKNIPSPARNAITGKIMPSKTMILRNHAGELTMGDLCYDAAFAMNGQPILQSKKTGNYFTLGWEDIARLAVAAGIDTEPQPALAAKEAR